MLGKQVFYEEEKSGLYAGDYSDRIQEEEDVEELASQELTQQTRTGGQHRGIRPGGPTLQD